MNKLLSVELKRAIISPILWIGLITVIAVNAYGIMFNTYGFDIYTTSFLLSNSGLICIVLALFIPLHIGHDFEVRTINNKISAGYTRKQIYITEVIISLICATSLFVIDIASVFLCSSIMHLEFSDQITYPAFIVNAIINLTGIITISSIFTMLVMITHKQLTSIGITVLLTLLMLNIGGNAVSNLKQTEYNIDPQTEALVENPLYISGLKRAATNLHLLISPFAQAEYASDILYESEAKEENSLVLKNCPYHIEFCIFNLLELILFCKLGIYIFRRQDLK